MVMRSEWGQTMILTSISLKHSLVWEQKPIATSPNVWVHHKLGDADDCTGVVTTDENTTATDRVEPKPATIQICGSVNAAASTTEQYDEIDTNSYVNGNNKAMVKHEFIAGAVQV